MLLNYIIWDVRPQIIQFDGFEIRWYSLLFGLGFVFGYMIMQKMFKRENISLELLDKLTFYIIIATILGARLGHCIFYEPEVYLKAPWKIFLPFTGFPGNNFKFTGFQGLASHGGAIGILLGLWAYCRKFKVEYLWILDRIAIVTALAAFFIRMGNLFNSEIYGRATDLPWGFKFMRETLYYRITPEEVVPKHPTQIYEALAYLIAFGVLIFLYNKMYKKLKQGFFIGLFLILIFTARFFIEFVKEDQVAFEAGMTLNMGQILSLPFIIGGIWLLVRKSKSLESK